jgi:hypothetical protein
MTETEPAQEPDRGERARAFLQRAATLEHSFYASIWRAIRRRPDLPEGAQGFGFHRSVLTVLIVFIGLSALELVILDLVLRRWLAIRIAVDALDAWALLWQLGLLCAFLMHPHTVGPDGIHVRDGLGTDVRVDWSRVGVVSRRVKRVEQKTPRVVESGGIREFAQRQQGETNLRIDLTEPVRIALPGRPPAGGEHEVERIRLWADDPQAFLEAAQRFAPPPHP